MSRLALAAALVTVLYAISALGRLVPVKRRHHSWKQVTGMSAVTMVVLVLAGGIFGTAHRGAGGAAHGGAGAATGEAAAASSTLPSSPSGTPDAGESLPVGVFAPGEWDSWSPVQQFSQQAGQPVRYVLDYLGPDEPFPARFGKLAAEHGAEPVLQMLPAMSMAGIAAGKDDAYLRSLSRQVSSYRHQVVLSFAPEANGNWYQFGWTRTPPAQYQAAWRHVVAEFKGVRNVTWMDTVNISYPGSGPLADYIVPGVMIGIDGYYSLNSRRDSFQAVFGSTLAQVRARTSAPVMISETAIQGAASQAERIPDLVKGAQAHHLAGLIWFNQDKGAGQHWQLTPAGAAALRASLSGRQPSAITP
jgi:hypothetical protein